MAGRRAPGGYPDYPSASSAQGGLLVRADSIGTGLFEVRLQPHGAYGSGIVGYYAAVNVESRDASGEKRVPLSYNTWLGSSVRPYSSAGYEYNPLLGSSESLIRTSPLQCEVDHLL